MCESLVTSSSEISFCNSVYWLQPDSVTLLTGALFWGCLSAGLLVGGLAGLLAFLIFWQGSLYFVQRVVAFAIGVVVIALIRISIVCYGRKKFFHSFYRTKPAAANIYFLAMEWANFALSVGFVIARTIKLLAVTAFYVGRIDSPLLAPGVGKLGRVELDPFPTIHMRDIMSHEAHRHPFIECLGKFYLMKLRYGSQFCTQAGRCWRLVFVLALMPWLQKYRDALAPSKVCPEMNTSKDETSFSKAGLRNSLWAAHSLSSVSLLGQEYMAEKQTEDVEYLRKRVAELEAKLRDCKIQK